MKLFTFTTFLVPLAAAQSTAPYTDPKSGLTFNTYIDPSGLFFGLTPKGTGNVSDFTGILGGMGTGYSGVSLGGAMTNKLLIVAWPNGEKIVSSFRKTPKYASPPVVTGDFTMTPIANGTYVNSTHWTYTFTCSKCIKSDQTTFDPSDKNPVLGWAVNTAAPTNKSDPAAMVSRHTSQGNFGLTLGSTEAVRAKRFSA